MQGIDAESRSYQVFEWDDHRTWHAMPISYFEDDGDGGVKEITSLWRVDAPRLPTVEEYEGTGRATLDFRNARVRGRREYGAYRQLIHHAMKDPAVWVELQVAEGGVPNTWAVMRRFNTIISDLNDLTVMCGAKIREARSRGHRA